MTAPLADAIVLDVEPFPGLETLGGWWRDLEARADARIFLAWPWVGCFLAESGSAPRLATARAGGVLVGLALLQNAVRPRYGGLVKARTLFLNLTGDPAMDCVYPEYNGFLVDRRFGAALEARMTGFLAQSSPAAVFDELRFSGVPERYIDHARATGLALHVQSDCPTAVVDLDAVRRSGKGYIEQLSSNRRYQIRRARRHFAALGPLALDAAGDVPEALLFFDGLVELHQRYWIGRGQPGSFGPTFALRFHRRLIAEALPSGAVELLRVRAGAQAVGYLYNFVWRGWVGAYASGFSYGGDTKATPGYVSFLLAIERHLALGNSVFDFMAGDSRYKMSLGKPGERLVWFDLQQPRLTLKLESLLRRWKGSGRSVAADQEQ